MAQANSEAFSPDGTDKVSRRKRFHTVLNKTVSSPPAKGEIPAFAWVIVHRPRAALSQIRQVYFRRAMDGMLFLMPFSCGNAFAFLFATQKIRGGSPLKIPRQHF